jgi:type II secretory pathway pseudopilin PulG
MRWFRSVARATKSQRGFTIAEVLIAATIMVSASLGLLSLFNGALQLSGLSAATKDAQRFASTVDERLKSLPFYVPYSSTVGKQDFDDYYYCPDATPRSPMTADTWGVAPDVLFTTVTDPRFTVNIKMVYVNDNLSESDMATGFGNGPIPPESGGSDKPVSAANKPFHMIKYQIKVAWKVNGQFTPTSNYTYMGLMTDTQFTANLGVSAMFNTSSDATKKGTVTAPGSTDIISAPNGASSIDVKIVGFGFRAGETITGTLMRNGVADIPITGLTPDSETELHGQITLDSGWSGGGGPPPWNPRRDPVKWSVRINVGTSYAAAYDSFVVQFPQPVRVTDGSSLTPKTATDTQPDLAVTCTGSNILNLGTGPDPYTDYAGATMRLVRTDNPASIINIMSGTLSYTGDSYGVSTDSVTGHFDMRGKSPGTYWVEVWNCKNRNSPGADGDACSPHDANMTLSLLQVNPIPSNAYVTGSDGGEVYVASGEKRHFGFRTRNYKYTVRIDGTDMGSVTLARLGIGGVPADGTGTRTVDASSVVADAGNTFVTATFDLSTVEDGYARTDDIYDWWVYVENSLTTQAKGSVSDIFQVRKPRPILYKDAAYVPSGSPDTGPGGIYHNYSGVLVRLTGECFDSSTYSIKYDSGSYAWGSTTYTVGTSDGGMAKGAPSVANDYTTWDTTLNLIHCRNTSNNIWVLMADGTTDNNFTSTKESPSRTYKFYVPVTTTDNSTLKAQAQSTTAANSAVYVDNSFHDCYFNWYYRWRWFYGANYETNAAVARAQRTVGHIAGDQEGQAMFTLRGQGFKDAIVGATSPVQLLRWYTDGWGEWWWEELCGQDNVNVANPASAAAALTDRQNLYVTVQLPNHGMPKEDASGEINCGSKSFPNRFNLQEVLTNG